ncbi:hypothetical protein LBMAG53_03240 [Planctomycetota bacterium]|nr:hypothetical protein LBMAG53_03240 [Planctomycetota bacterium]
MDLLRSLWLNCWLAPITVMVVGMAVLTAYHLIVARQISTAHLDSLRQVQSAYAKLESRGSRPSLDDAVTVDPRWRCLAEVRIVGDHLAILSHAGAPPELDVDNPPPELLQAVGEQQAWQTASGDLAMATALRSADGQATRILFGQARLPDPGLTALFSAALGVLLVAGLALGGYLAKRIYRPIEALARDAEAALDGSPPSGPMPVSAETDGVRGSLVTLVERYRSSGPQRMRSPAQTSPADDRAATNTPLA